MEKGRGERERERALGGLHVCQWERVTWGSVTCYCGYFDDAWNRLREEDLFQRIQRRQTKATAGARSMSPLASSKSSKIEKKKERGRVRAGDTERNPSS